MKVIKSIFIVGMAALILVSMPLLASGQSSVQVKGKLTFWHLWGGTRTKLIDEMLEKFQQKFPEVSIEKTFVSPDILIDKIFHAAGTGTLPDVFSTNTGWYINIHPEKTVVNFDPLIKRDGINLKNILIPAEEQRCYWKGKLYSLPNVTGGGQGLFFYNKGLMRKAGLDPDKDLPTNWNELVVVSKILVDKLNPGNQLDAIAWNPFQRMGQPPLVMLGYGSNVPVISEDTKTSLLDSPGVIEIVKAFDKYIQDIYGRFGGYKALIDWDSRVIGAEFGGNVVMGFVQDRQVFFASGSWVTGHVNEGNPSMDLGVCPIPGFKRQHGGTVNPGWSYAISNNCKDLDAAWELVKFLTIDPEGNGEFCKAQKRPCPIAAVNQDPIYEEMGELWTNLIRTMELDIPTPNWFQDSVSPFLDDIPSRRLAGQTVEQIMKDIDSEFQDFLDDTWAVLE